jgi:hypothetical protein
MGFEKKQDIFTFQLTSGTLTIDEEDGITAVALLLTAGAGSYTGTKTVNGVVSAAVPLAVDFPITITSEQTKYISDLTIDASAGTIQIIAR